MFNVGDKVIGDFSSPDNPQHGDPVELFCEGEITAVPTDPTGSYVGRFKDANGPDWYFSADIYEKHLKLSD